MRRRPSRDVSTFTINLANHSLRADQSRAFFVDPRHAARASRTERRIARGTCPLNGSGEIRIDRAFRSHRFSVYGFRWPRAVDGGDRNLWRHGICSRTKTERDRRPYGAWRVSQSPASGNRLTNFGLPTLRVRPTFRVSVEEHLKFPSN